MAKITLNTQDGWVNIGAGACQLYFTEARTLGIIHADTKPVDDEVPDFPYSSGLSYTTGNKPCWAKALYNTSINLRYTDMQANIVEVL